MIISDYTIDAILDIRNAMIQHGHDDKDLEWRVGTKAFDAIIKADWAAPWGALTIPTPETRMHPLLFGIPFIVTYYLEPNTLGLMTKTNAHAMDEQHNPLDTTANPC
jgi:hypothetical protein